MKTLFIIIIILAGTNLKAQQLVEARIKVKGNCEECKARIERAADISGVKSVSWDINTKVAVVYYNPVKTQLQKICVAITQAGHDTDSLRANARAYKRLPDCCHYREKSCEKP